jgi:hypothetical protein
MMAVNKLTIILLLLPVVASAQSSDTAQLVNKKRLNTLIIASTAVYGITLAGLNELWYEDSPKESFHFFNDNGEWKQVDKIGHLYSTYYFSYGTSRALRWCNVKERKSDLIGSLVGFGIMLPIEIMDGFSQSYGASAGDLVANAAGSAFFLGQALLWKEQRLLPKFSFHRTDYAALRPSVLGDGMPGEMFKDYNGQTYWLSVDMDKFIRFPKWLNIAVGYGAEGMVYARDEQNIEAGYPEAYRQYYLSIDFDLRAIKSRSKAVNTLIFFASMIKIPAPTIEFSSKGTRFHPLYF